ncbi:thiamine ABC transporter substrate binding subunit [Halobaculum sp. MBLA0147]|uniref:thiamine ABC transporter substrate-binding protein n=1 Tax=Halobaculum sp. MBLA0147 TaxID=3079934 RepID=UPI003524B689
MKRRTYLGAVGAGAAALVSGCQAEPVATESETASGSGSGETETTGATTGTATETADTLVVATYPPFVNAPSSSPGAWLKRRFEERFDATLIYQTPENELNYYLERAIQGVDFETDVYVGLDTEMLLRVDRKRGSGQFTEPLFRSADGIGRRDTVQSDLEFDPDGRAVPFSSGYICLVWDATAEDGTFTAPETFEELATSGTAAQLLAQNPTSSSTGKAFMLHTVDRFGADGFLDYWDRLREDGVTVLGNWSDSYAAYGEGEAAMVVSYSTDQVYANRYDQNMDRHQLRFLNDQGYANPEGAAVFRQTDSPQLAEQFVDFLLEPEIQAGIAKRNVTFPAIPDAPLSDTYDEYAVAPPEAVTFSYSELKGKVGEWTDQWSRRFANG